MTVQQNTANLLKNLMPIQNLLKQDYTIPEEDRANYSIPFTYIDERVKTIEKLLPQTSIIDQNTNSIHFRMKEVQNRVNATHNEYQKFSQAISRLKKCMDDMDNIAKETENVYEHFKRIEEKLQD